MTLRTELPDAPARIAALPVDRGYPVPWFVAWLDGEGEPVARGEGTPEFRVLAPGATSRAVREHRCWICGQRLGRHKAFVVGPMCAINRVSAEPPSHVECAEWAVRACPFMVRPHMQRREAGLPADAVEPAGDMLKRNPGVSLVWVTQSFRQFPATGGGVLFRMGNPDRVAFYAQGRAATRVEIEESIDTGLPALIERAEEQGDAAIDALERYIAEARRLIPA